MERKPDEPIYTGREGGVIELETAAQWTKHYREQHPDETISQFFGKEILERILAQENCIGLRFYYALDKPRGHKHLVVTGVIGNGGDQIPAHEKPCGETEPDAATAATAAPQMLAVSSVAPKNVVGDQSIPCPGQPGCPKNVLTGD